MKVILSRDVKDLGRSGDVVNVAEGYARNFLLPRKLATVADAGAMANLEKKRKLLDLKGEQIKAQAEAIAERLKDARVTIEGKTGAGSTKLYGSITSEDIAQALLKQQNISVDKRKIHIDEPIKSLGTFEVPIRLHHDVSANIHVEVVPKAE